MLLKGHDDFITNALSLRFFMILELWLGSDIVIRLAMVLSLMLLQ